MKELADDNPKETVKFGNREMEMVGVSCLQGLPNRQAEGPFAFEANGWYYLTYPYVRENTEVLGYAMSKSPMGPYEYKGRAPQRLLDQPPQHRELQGPVVPVLPQQLLLAQR